MIKRNILIVDDEPTQCKVLSKFIGNMGHSYLVMSSGMQVVDFFMNKKIIDGISCHDIDVMMLDLSMPDLDGLTVLKEINPIKGDLQVIVLTASKDISSAISAINLGAIDYIVKGEKDIFARVTASINNAVEKKNLKYQVSHLARKGKDQVAFSDIIGQSTAISNVVKLAKKAINSSIPILIEGPTGSGKELLARAIHGSSLRSGKPFVIVECDLLRSSTAEEELFGSDKTTADGTIKNIGKIREANNGTVFFEKIDSLKMDLQVKILRFLQEGEFEPVGSNQVVRVNVRVISSTNRDLLKMVEMKKFREDLRYRIASLPIIMPSLRERGEEDIKLLAENFCRNFSINENKKIKGISNDALYLLGNYEWEDNIRQLKNSIFRAVVLCDEDFLKPEHFPQLLNKENNSLTKSKAAIKDNSDINSELIDIFDDEGKCKTLDIIEEEIIKRLVDIYNGNLSEVAKQLDVGRSTIYRKLKIIEQ
ncbi:MAG: sigma-54 dependent transcriptional regulator [Rickettsiales bacterium]|nr:sigma-54 dependent transcriptional regulator [Rickettsiales bacterium]